MKKQIILASSSPRRKQLFAEAGIDVIIKVPDINEQPKAGESADTYVRRNAREKAQAACALLTEAEAKTSVIVTADTIVVTQQGKILEKPTSDPMAVAMLESLSGTWHQVFTAYCLLLPEEAQPRVQEMIRSKVIFRDLSPQEITDYVNTREPFDKAGGYGIQGRGSVFVKAIEGSYTNVVGLPLCEVVQDLITHAGLQLNTPTLAYKS